MNADTATLKAELQAVARRYGVTLPEPPPMSPEENERQVCRGEYLGFKGRSEDTPERAERQAAVADLQAWKAERQQLENARRRNMP